MRALGSPSPALPLTWQEQFTWPRPHPQLLEPRSGSHRQVQLSSQTTGQRPCASRHSAVLWPIKEGLPRRRSGSKTLSEATPPSWNGASRLFSGHKTTAPQTLLSSTFTPKRLCFRKLRCLRDCFLGAAGTPQGFALIQHDFRPPNWEVPLIALATGKRE